MTSECLTEDGHHLIITFIQYFQQIVGTSDRNFHASQRYAAQLQQGWKCNALHVGISGAGATPKWL